jgi:hypothetical protein
VSENIIRRIGFLRGFPLDDDFSNEGERPGPFEEVELQQITIIQPCKYSRKEISAG